MPTDPTPTRPPLRDVVDLSSRTVLPPTAPGSPTAFDRDQPVLVILAAGKGTRFGTKPKCIQPVHGTPLARHSIDAFRRMTASPVIGLVGYRWEEVSAKMGPQNFYVRSQNPTGGTAFAAYEALATPGLLQADPVVIITMGDRIVPASIFARLYDLHRQGPPQADLTFLTARYEPPRHRGKGRILRDPAGRVLRIVEERDILAAPEGPDQQALLEITEGNCPLYAIRAGELHRRLGVLTNDNAQQQFYLTDIIEALSRDGGDIRTVTTTPAESEYDLLVSDVTRPRDLALLEGKLDAGPDLLQPDDLEIEQAAQAIAADRPPAQVAAIARQLGELLDSDGTPDWAFQPDEPVGIGISGGRQRLAFMHPDMMRFYGPAWQMPIGAGDENGNEQIVLLVQPGDDRKLSLLAANPTYREMVTSIAADDDMMYPGREVADLHAYEAFGTKMSQLMLMSMGYFSDDELDRRREASLPLPPPLLWVSSNLRRPFALIGNAIASLRTLREGNLGARVERVLGRQSFSGLRLVLTGDIPRGGFSSSSAVTLATKNGINALYDLGIPADLLVHLACQAEYGTGVRAGSLDQATEQKGRAGCGTLISSNPRDNYHILGTYPVPRERIRILFPYTVPRDLEAWRWSWGFYAESPTGPSGVPTAGEMRKLTGKAAEMAALLVELPLETDFFKQIEDDLLDQGELSTESLAWIADVLRRTPLLPSRTELETLLHDAADFHAAQLAEQEALTAAQARRKAGESIASLLTGWREPSLPRSSPDGRSIRHQGIPLRAMLAYLFCEVVRNFRLIHHPDEWIRCVSLSQQGDRCVRIDPQELPDKDTLLEEANWEAPLPGPARMDAWLQRCNARWVDFNAGLDEETLAAGPPDLLNLQGGNFFRGLALVDLAEAMLKRAFGPEAVAVRVNAAGQGDYIQAHIDTDLADVEEVKQFLRTAYYRRFGLAPQPEFVELHSGGGAVGTRLSRYAQLPRLIQRLKHLSR